MDGFTGFKTATTEELPDAAAVIDPFHVVRLGGDAMDQCRRRVQQCLHGHHGRKSDPLYNARGTLHTGADLLNDKQRQRITALFTADEHVIVVHGAGHGWIDSGAFNDEGDDFDCRSGQYPDHSLSRSWRQSRDTSPRSRRERDDVHLSLPHKGAVDPEYEPTSVPSCDRRSRPPG